MTNIIVVLPKLEEAKGVKNILVRSGFQVTGICTTGTQAISQADGLNDGIVICSYKLADMIYTELHDDLPEDVYSIDLMNAYQSLGLIIGESVEDDLMTEIFSKFCMGK